MHYQQKADILDGGTTNNVDLQAFNTHSGNETAISNQATIRYLTRIGNETAPTILDISPETAKERREQRRDLASRGRRYPNLKPAKAWLSMTFYACGPLLTITAIVLVILTRDWWAFGIILALMVSRALNVYIIRARTKPRPAIPQTPDVHQNWWVHTDGRNICLRGHSHDLDAITTGVWMRNKTHIEGYMEATAKIIVYLVAIFSGNTFQSGDIILLVLLSSSAALLALSNAHSSSFNMNGRVANVVEKSLRAKGDPLRHRQRPFVGTMPDRTSGSVDDTNWDEKKTNSMSDFERHEAQTVIDSVYPFDEDVNYV